MILDRCNFVRIQEKSFRFARSRHLILSMTRLQSPLLPPCNDNLGSPAASPCSPVDRKWILVATILGSTLAFMDGSVVNIALPTLQAKFGATAGAIQWVVKSYALLGAALLLLGGALGDRYGRRRAFVWESRSSLWPRPPARRPNPSDSSSSRDPFKARAQRCWCRKDSPSYRRRSPKANADAPLEYGRLGPAPSPPSARSPADGLCKFGHGG